MTGMTGPEHYQYAERCSVTPERTSRAATPSATTSPRPRCMPRSPTLPLLH